MNDIVYRTALATRDLLKTVLTPQFFPINNPSGVKGLTTSLQMPSFLLPNFMLSDMLKIRSALKTTGSFQYFASLLQMI